MGIKAAAIVAVVVALFLAGTFAMHGKGHKMLAKWMPALHGR
jgi:hypothetical protein